MTLCMESKKIKYSEIEKNNGYRDKENDQWKNLDWRI